MKFVVIRLLRGTHLLRLADGCQYWIGRAKAQARNASFSRQYPDFSTPPRHLSFDALNHVDWHHYRDSGVAHARLFSRIIGERVAEDRLLDVLEWGCGPGRLIRHMPEFLGARARSITGSDYNPESIAWCRNNVPRVDFQENGLNPPLPFRNESFDVVYNFSVFTHLSEAVMLAWSQELRRVLKPGGLIICTTHGDAYRYLLASSGELERYEAGDLVVQGNYREGRKWFFALHPEPFVRERLLAGFVGVERYATTPEDRVLQDVWVAQKSPL